MSSKKKSGSKGQKGRPNNPRTSSTWKLFPLYGLALDDEKDGFNDPLWGDATLVSLTVARERVARGATSDAVLVLTHGRLSEALGERTPGNRETLVEFPPEGYVAVRARGDEAAERRRAEKIRAMLTGTRFLRGLRATAFCGNPREYAWYLAPKSLTLGGGAPPSAQIQQIVNPNIVQKPVSVSKQALRNSVRTGAPIIAGESWDLHYQHGICRVLNTLTPSSLEKRIITSALIAQDAACSSNFAKLQLAVTSYEILFNTKNFTDLEKRVSSFVVKLPNGLTLQDIFKSRHDLTHRARQDNEASIEALSTAAVVVAWTLIDIATAFSEKLTAKQFDEYVDALVRSRELDEVIGRVIGEENYRAHRQLVHEATKEKRGALSLNQSPPP